ncbi:hypothetical protein Dimus_030498, partial [Dionaea muscipula]
QVPPQDLINANADLEIVGEGPDVMEVNTDDQNVDEDEELFGIDDVDAFIDLAVEKTFDDIFEGIADKVGMNLVEVVVRELKDKEKVAATKPQTYRRGIKAKKSKRKLIVLEEEEDADAEITTPQDDVVLTTSRDSNREATGMEIVMYQAPIFASKHGPASTPLHGENTAYIDMFAHIEQAVKCLLSAIEEQSTVMKALLKHLEFHGSQDGKQKLAFTFILWN